MWPPTLEDDQVVLRPIDPGDRESIYSVLSTTPDIARWTRVPFPYERTHLQQFFSLVETWHGARSDAVWAMTSPDDARLRGCIGAHRIGAPWRARSGFLPDEPGYWLMPEARGRGSMTRALTLVTDWLLDDLGRPEVNIQVKVGNAASRAVIERVGFVHTGTVLATEVDDDPMPVDHERFVLRR